MIEKFFVMTWKIWHYRKTSSDKYTSWMTLLNQAPQKAMRDSWWNIKIWWSIEAFLANKISLLNHTLVQCKRWGWLKAANNAAFDDVSSLNGEFFLLKLHSTFVPADFNEGIRTIIHTMPDTYAKRNSWKDLQVTSCFYSSLDVHTAIPIVRAVNYSRELETINFSLSLGSELSQDVVINAIVYCLYFNNVLYHSSYKFCIVKLCRIGINCDTVE